MSLLRNINWKDVSLDDAPLPPAGVYVGTVSFSEVISETTSKEFVVATFANLELVEAVNEGETLVEGTTYKRWFNLAETKDLAYLGQMFEAIRPAHDDAKPFAEGGLITFIDEGIQTTIQFALSKTTKPSKVAGEPDKVFGNVYANTIAVA